MGNIKTKSNKNKILIYFIAAIGIAVIILITIIFATRKSALEKCADVGFIYIWGEQNKAYLNKSFKEKMNDNKNFKDFPYTKIFGICDQSQQQYPEKFKEKMSDIKTFKDFPYAKLFAICDQSQKQYPEKFEEKWGK